MTSRWCLVTGGAGFVGSRVIRALNDAGCDRILLVDSFSRRPEKLDGISGLRFADFRDYFQFYTRAEGVLAWVAERTARPLEKMVGYWTELAKSSCPAAAR